MGWCILLRMQREIAATRRELGGEIHGMRQELGKLRDDIGADMVGLRDELRADMTQLRDELRAEMATVRTDIASGRDGLVIVGEGLAELRGEVRGVQKAILAMQEDFRIHVYGRRARA